MQKTETAKPQLPTGGRIETLDIAKGLGMLFVVFAHVNYTPGVLESIYAFHMPLFFILAGMVFKREKYSSFGAFLKKRIKTLICPYVLFYIVSILLQGLIMLVSDGMTAENKGKILSYAVQMFLSQGSVKAANAPLWFVPCLLAAEMLYYFIASMRKPYIVIVCTLAVGLGWILESGILPFNNKLLPWSLDSALFALGFYAIGNLLSPKIIETLQKAEGQKKLVPFLVFVLSFGIMVPLGLMNGHVTLGSKVLNNGFILYATGILGTIGILAVSLMLKNCKFLKFCGINSFYIMASHYMIRVYLRHGYTILGMDPYDIKSLAQTAVPFLIVLMVSVLFTLGYVNVKKKLLSAKN